MPIETNQPVHIHGLFAIVPDRSRLSSSGPDSEWNRFMFEECVSATWTDLLLSRRHVAWKDSSFRLWPRISTSDNRELWASLDNAVIDQVIAADLPVWNTPNCCLSTQDGFFAPDGDEVRTYSDAFQSIHLPLVCLENCMYDKVLLRAAKLDKHVPTLSPQLVRQHLRENSQHRIPRAHSPMILQYCLLDFMSNATAFGLQAKIHQEFHNLHLWPTMQNCLMALNGNNFILPRDTEEMQLFKPSRQSETLDLDCLTELVVEFLKGCTKHLSSFIRYRVVADLENDWAHMYPLQSLESQLEVRPRVPGNDSMVQDIWSWIWTRCKDAGESSIISSKSLNNLFLVPINGLRIRRFTFTDSEHPTLIAEDDDWICDLIGNDEMEKKPELDFVLDVKCLPAEGIRLLKSVAKKRLDTVFSTSDDLRSLVTWLTANKDQLKTQPVRHKELLIQKLRLLTELGRSSLQLAGKALLKDSITQLPIFKQVYAVSPFK